MEAFLVYTAICAAAGAFLQYKFGAKFDAVAKADLAAVKADIAAIKAKVGV